MAFTKLPLASARTKSTTYTNSGTQQSPTESRLPRRGYVNYKVVVAGSAYRTSNLGGRAPEEGKSNARPFQVVILQHQQQHWILFGCRRLARTPPLFAAGQRASPSLSLGVCAIIGKAALSVSGSWVMWKSRMMEHRIMQPNISYDGQQVWPVAGQSSAHYLYANSLAQIREKASSENQVQICSVLFHPVWPVPSSSSSSPAPRDG